MMKTEITQASLPASWTVAELGDVLERITNGLTTCGQEKEPPGIPITRIETISNGIVDFERVRYVRELEESKKERFLLRHGDILFSHINSDLHLGKTAVVTSDKLLLHGMNLLLLRTKKELLDPYYLHYLFNFYRRNGTFMEIAQHAVNQSSLNQKKINSLKIPLVPLNEQHRIVAKIEELFSELDKGIENFKTAREQLKVYRQALLKHAFSGKLTEHWRAENPDKLESAEILLQRIQTEREQRYQQQLNEWEANGRQGSKPKAPRILPQLTAEELAELPKLPQGWVWYRLGEFISYIDAGKSFKCDEREPLDNETGVAKVSAVTWGEYNESESKTCVDASKVNSKYFIRKGDFILSRANTIDLVGACVIAKNVTKNIMLSDKTLRIVFSGFSQEYFLHYLRSRMGRKQIMYLSTGNQESMRNIGQDRIQSIVVPICSLSESMATIDILESKLSTCDQLDQTLTIALQQAEALRQSILKKAFSGQLVPQDPNDEPAQKLLERIKAEKAERATQNKLNKNQKRKTLA